MKNQRKNNSILKFMLLSFFLTVFLKPYISSAQNIERQEVEQTEQSQEELNLALFAAVMGGLEDKVKELMTQGIDANVQDEKGLPPLVYAVMSGNVNIVKLLVENGARFDVTVGGAMTAIHAAAIAGSREMVEVFIFYGADIPPLHSAAVTGDVARLSSLLAQGVDVNMRDKGGWTPLLWAICLGQTEVVELLVAAGADVNAGWNAGLMSLTPLSFAVERGQTEITEILIKNGSEITSEIANWIIQGGSKEVTEILLNDKTFINIILFLAAQKGNQELIEQVLDRGVGVNGVDEYGMTALHYAVEAGHVDIVKLLLIHQARVDIKDNAGRTPLHYSAGAEFNKQKSRTTMPEVIRILLDNNADINVQDNIGLTPLHYAVRVGSKVTIQFLIDNGADVNVPDNRGCTPYMWLQEVIFGFKTVSPEFFNSKGLDQFSELVDLFKRNVYYVATSGKNNNPGTRDAPFGSLNAAIEVAAPGDTILLRGGEYVCLGTIHIDKSGYLGRPIYLRAYPGEVPILDFSQSRSKALYITGSYWHIKGLVLVGGKYHNVLLYEADHNILEQITASGAHMPGIHARRSAYNLILNCDSHHNFDPEHSGENGDGFGIFYSGPGNVLIGNRSWDNSDDAYGFTDSVNGVRAEWCYAWRSGKNIWNHPFFRGNGEGFKLSRGTADHVLVNCFSWHNNSRGFVADNTGNITILSCTKSV